MHGSAQVDRASGDLAGSFGLPEVQPGWVPRDDIVRLLDLAFHQRVTIVVAPAGYGKTTLLTQWAASHLPGRVRWLSVTDEHNGSSTMGPAFLSALAEAIEETAPIALVMDDFQRLAPVLALEIAELIDAAPDTVHLVVVTRQHPPLPFYRVGLSDLQVEIGPDVLAFADDVGAELLHRVSDRGLTEAETAALLDRAEGWPAGLAMAGDDTRIASYFDEQVLRGIPADMYEFLRTTCVLQELDGSLCDFLTGRPGGDAMLDALSERSLFIARSGEGRSRWRYHPLFSARLRDQLHHDDPVLERRLLLRAAEWHLAHDEFAAGMGYLVEAGAWNEALTAAFEHGPRLLTTGEPAAVARWLAPVADNLPAPRVDVLLLQAAGYLFGGDPAASENIMDAIAAMSAVSPAERLVADLLQGYRSMQQGRIRQALAAVGRVAGAIETVDDGQLPNLLGLTGSRVDILAAAGVIRGVALVYEGKLAEAKRSLQLALDGCHAVWRVSAFGALALVEAWSGRLMVGEDFGLQALKMADELGLADRPVTAIAYLALATISRERDDLDQAQSFLAETWQRSGPDQSRLVTGVFANEQALLAAATGRPAIGLRLLAARQENDHPSMPAAVLARRRAVKGRLLVAAGNLDAAEQTLSFGAAFDDPDVAAARMRLAIEEGELGAARCLASRWPEPTTPRTRIERHLWLSVLQYLEGNERASQIDMAAAVAEAQPEGDLAPFRMAGQHVLGPARALYRSTPTPFVRAIVEQPAAPGPPRRSVELVEQLTRREYLVLNLLPTRLSNAEIAGRLDVSLNTVKTHLKHIYRKLDVPGRSEAVREADRLRLL